MAAKKDPLTVVGAIAMRLPSVEVGIACAGTAAESTTYKVNGKAFLFVRAAALMLKLAESVPEAAKLSAKEPARYQTGSSGWTTIKRPADAPLPMDKIERWIGESYRLMAASPARKAAAKKKAAKAR